MTMQKSPGWRRLAGRRRPSNQGAGPERLSLDCLPGGGRLANAAGVEARVDPVEGRGWVGDIARDEKRVRDDERAAQLLAQTEADARRPATPGRPLILGLRTPVIYGVPWLCWVSAADARTVPGALVTRQIVGIGTLARKRRSPQARCREVGGFA
jgi:hypothetical protein